MNCTLVSEFPICVSLESKQNIVEVKKAVKVSKAILI